MSGDVALALPTSGAFLVEASAGTGKTFTLTAWVLRLLLETGVPLPNLLAVTFTRAATAELRERVRKRLRVAEKILSGASAGGGEAEQTRALLDHALAGGIGAETLRQRLQAALLQLDEAAISTIHGFCQRALREFGFLAGALDDDELLDNADEAWSDVAADLWRAAGNGDAGRFAWLAGLWPTPDKLARDLRDLCDPARKLLPDADESAAAAWLHDLRDDATRRFGNLLGERRQRTQDQLIERVWRATESPRFCAALKKRWPVALVDEFQDTDPRQWDIFKRVFEAEAETDAAGLFLIGDPKQAIYRFRGGDLGTYLEAREYAIAHGGETTLTVNYRSRPAVLQGIEALFAASAAPFVEPGIRFVHVEAAERNRGAALRIGDEAQPGVTLHWLPPDEGASSRLAKAAAENVTVNEIVRLLGGGKIVDADGERAVRPGDIAVLTRSNRQAERVRAALAAAGVAATLQSGASVFASAAADEILRLLHALAAPSEPARVRAALATRLMGRSARDIAALDGDAGAMQAELLRFEEGLQRWRARGPLPALLPFVAQGSPRLLKEDGGARLLTDALHLCELLQAESPAQHGVNGLLRWFARQWSDEENRDELALRMETDAQAVQVLTLHKSKGLEYPVVFMPFSAFESGAPGGRVKKTLARDGGDAAIYFHAETGGVELRSRSHAQFVADEKRDDLAEDLRLFYVGLTRAKCAVHLTGGCTRTQDFNASPLRWLLFGGRQAGSDAKSGQVRTAAMVEQARAGLEALARSSGGALVLRDVPAGLPVKQWHPVAEGEAPPDASVAERALRTGGGQYSFSGLRARHAEALPARGADDEAQDLGGGDDVAQLRGADFGNAVHDALEAADFAAWRGRAGAPESQRELLRRVLKKRGLPTGDKAVAQVGNLVARALNAPLPGIATLAQLDASRRIAEMEFHFRLGATRLPQLYALLERHGYPRRHPPAHAGEIDGLMHGYVDLVYRDDAGAHRVLDYKTNTLRGYSPAECGEAVRDNDYDLQYLIYLVALQRWLRLRFGGDYDAQKHLGGAVYLFLRGLKPGDAESGIHRDRPPRALLDALDALFDGSVA